MGTSALLPLGFPVYPLSHCHAVVLQPLSSSFLQELQFISAQKRSFYRMVRKGCCMLFTQIQWFWVKLSVFGRTYPKVFATIMATLHLLWAYNATGNFSSKDSSVPLTIQLWKAKLPTQNFGFHELFRSFRFVFYITNCTFFSLTVQGNDWQWMTDNKKVDCDLGNSGVFFQIYSYDLG